MNKITCLMADFALAVDYRINLMESEKADQYFLLCKHRKLFLFTLQQPLWEKQEYISP